MQKNKGLFGKWLMILLLEAFENLSEKDKLLFSTFFTMYATLSLTSHITWAAFSLGFLYECIEHFMNV